LSRHGVREVRRQLRESGAVGVVAVLLVTVTSVLGGALWTARHWVEGELLSRGKATAVVAVVRGSADAEALRAPLRAAFPTASATTMPPAKVQDELSNWFPELSTVLLTMNETSFPTLLQIETSPSSEADVAAWLRHRPEVSIVETSQGWQARVRETLSRALFGGFVLIGTMLLGCCVVVLLVVRLLVLAHADEIAIMRLIGAHDGDIRRPYLVSGSLLGLVGGCLGAICLLAGTFAFKRSLPTLSVAPVAVAALPLGGALAGLIGAALGLASLPSEP
jgi:cell division protein FtsX